MLLRRYDHLVARARPRVRRSRRVDSKVEVQYRQRLAESGRRLTVDSPLWSNVAANRSFADPDSTHPSIPRSAVPTASQSKASTMIGSCSPLPHRIDIVHLAQQRPSLMSTNPGRPVTSETENPRKWPCSTEQLTAGGDRSLGGRGVYRS
jgi:hypothetical protein